MPGINAQLDHWLAGEKIRIADIDTPEMNGQCAAKAKARLARDRLRVLLNRGEFVVHGKVKIATAERSPS